MSSRPAETPTRRNLRWSMIDGSAYSVMVGIGELILPAFVLALALGEVASGLIATLPPVVGGALQLGSHWGVRWLGSHKRWVLVMVALQVLSFVPLVIGAVWGTMPAWGVFAAAVAYWLGGAGAGAAWSTWIGTLVPGPIRPHWFGLRQRALQIGTLVGFIAAGVTLGLLSSGEGLQGVTQGGGGGGGGPAARAVLIAFAGLFAVAGLCRAVSFLGLTKQSEPAPMPAGHRGVGVGQLWKRLRSDPRSVNGGRGGDVRLIAYMLAVSLASQIAAPFVNPFLLEQHKTGYVAWSLLVGLVMLGKIITLAALGRYARRHGARRLLWIGGVGMTFVGFMWAMAPASPAAGSAANAWPFFAWLVFVQLYSGFVWACYELATWLLLLEHLDEHERTSLMSVYFAGNFLAAAVGSLLGGWLLATLGQGAAAYQWIFVVSSVARLATVVPLWRVAQRARQPQRVRVNTAGTESLRATE